MNKLDLKAIRKISEERYYNECGFLREYQNNGNKPLDHTDKESLDIEYDWTLGQFKRYLELTNKPVETTNERPKKDLNANVVHLDVNVNRFVV